MDTSAELDANGWFTVLTSFSNVVLWGGIYKSLGVLLPTLTEQFTDHTWLTGVAISFMGLAADISGLLTTLLEDKFGRRRMLILSTLTVCVGLMLVPLATSIVHIAIVLAVVVGPALGISSVLSKVLLGRHFNKRYTLASGISQMGQVVSLLAFAPMTQLFLDTYGWRGAALLLAGVCLHSVVCPVLVKEEKERYETPPDQHDHKETNSTALYALTDVLTKELLGRERLTSAFAWIGALGVPAKLLAGFLPGWLYDSSGSYDLAFIIMGASPTVAAIPLVIGKFWKEI
ncbi:monocarboxylate transporter 13-like isoform X4 [Acanthaster planci]|uniref:Monocarboxylate transporter 13-like isoform X4 n=1 Tax=Acanthaster planci TaxID=133434 RepID=A0A8B7Y053_ACAPL|nr:monocarboxylate transporter 13-like isoform X4 [Acanthaster planci]